MSSLSKGSFLSLQENVSGLEMTDAFNKLNEVFPGQLTLSTSFSLEDQVLTDCISELPFEVSVFTLDTGRLFPETYATWTRTIERYPISINAFYPDAERLQEFVLRNGPNSFYESVVNRQRCCHIRKVEPLKKALAGNAVWVTGLRAEHSPNRSDMQLLEWDEGNQIIKFNPLLHWTTADVRQYIDGRNIPYNVLHDRGFVSIGCLPCTRAVKPGEDFRAGRWWWEDTTKKECGLHTHKVITT